MIEYGYIALLVVVVIFADFRVMKGSAGGGDPMASPFNGISAIPWVLTGKSKSPMQFRALIPWMCKVWGAMFGPGTEKYAYLNFYLRVRWLAITAALYLPYFYFESVGVRGVYGVTFLALFYIVAAIYDYTDNYIEVSLMSLCFLIGTNDSWLAVMAIGVICLVGGINRETMLFVGPILAFSGNIYAGVFGFAGAVGGWLWPRAYYGPRERYCDFNMVRVNINAIASDYHRGTPFVYSEYFHFFALLLTTSVVYAWTALIRPLTAIEFGMGILFAALLVPTMWREIRVFAPTLLATIPMGLKLCQ